MVQRRASTLGGRMAYETMPPRLVKVYNFWAPVLSLPTKLARGAAVMRGILRTSEVCSVCARLTERLSWASNELWCLEGGAGDSHNTLLRETIISASRSHGKGAKPTQPPLLTYPFVWLVAISVYYLLFVVFTLSPVVYPDFPSRSGTRSDERKRSAQSAYLGHCKVSFHSAILRPPPRFR